MGKMNKKYQIIINKIKNAIKNKKRSINIKTNISTLKFLYFLLLKGFIAGFESNNSISIIFLKYTFNTNNSLKEVNIKRSIKIDHKTKKQKNFIVKFSKNKEKNIVGKFR